ncbi:PREDICTED: neuronal acetylcholine receptor subunit alpha-10-like isoform X1 [Branchiostoma belcheri]|uniref:Neuronal acetylcholine receptor subunit alpha-10-like isoform X1 n=1 Tax=Branchiostoma belcheri TaxID=7741 RepID=A0A6P4ZI97_BRABE|nr:PREDICTED: neuronal acetylcholine receptor subunit alpha-10-like isoform X1 [Branchiostoma belcheri]
MPALKAAYLLSLLLVTLQQAASTENSTSLTRHLENSTSLTRHLENSTSLKKPDILRLHEDLFVKSGYHPYIRPIRDLKRPTNVTLDLAMANIINLDEKNQVLTAEVWLRMKWTDEFLTWNVSEYGGIETIATQAENIWRPDMFLYHNVNHEFGGWLEDVVMISSDGQVDWKAPAVTMSACLVDVSDFPFDKQKCYLQFGSWNQDGRHVDYFSESEVGDMANLIRNVEWDVPKLSVERHEHNFNGVPYPDVTFTMHMTRRSTFYVINMFLPCALLAFVVGATFYLPPDCGEKISFGVSVLLTLTVFQLVVAQEVPQSESVPTVGLFIIVSLALMTLSLLATTFVMNLGDSGEENHPVPGWARKVFLKYISRALLMGDQSGQNEDELWYRYNAYPSPEHMKNNTIYINRKVDGNSIYSGTERRSRLGLPARPERKSRASPTKLEYLLEIKGAVEEISAYMEKLDTVKNIHNDWKTLATVVDRIFLVLYLVACIIALVVTLLNLRGFMEPEGSHAGDDTS